MNEADRGKAGLTKSPDEGLQSLDPSRNPADRDYAGQLIEYRLSPLPGMLAHALLAGRQLEHIFAYRRERVEAIFGPWASPTTRSGR